MAQGQVGPVEAKLTALGRVHGIVGAFGEACDDIHSLIHHSAASRVQCAGSQKGKRGQLSSMAGERDRVVQSTSILRKPLSVCAVRGQARVLLGRLDVMGPGAATAAMRRNNPLLLERRWARQKRGLLASATCLGKRR